MMKRIFLLTLGALAFASSARADINEAEAMRCGKTQGASEYSIWGQRDAEHIENQDRIIIEFQDEAVRWGGAQTPDEIDQFVRVA